MTSEPAAVNASRLTSSVTSRTGDHVLTAAVGVVGVLSLSCNAFTLAVFARNRLLRTVNNWCYDQPIYWLGRNTWFFLHQSSDWLGRSSRKWPILCWAVGKPLPTCLPSTTGWSPISPPRTCCTSRLLASSLPCQPPYQVTWHGRGRCVGRPCRWSICRTPWAATRASSSVFTASPASSARIDEFLRVSTLLWGWRSCCEGRGRSSLGKLFAIFR